MKLSKKDRIEKHNFVEHSAGGIVYRVRNQPEVLMMLDLKNNWTFPKGWIEEGESIEEAAKREIQEEVGISDLKQITHLQQAKYIYYFEGKLVRKLVDYFLFFSEGSEKLTPQLEEGIQKAQWVSLDEAARIVGYPQTNKPILEKAIKIIEERANH